MNAIVSGRSARALLLDGESLKSFDLDDPATLVPRRRSDLPYLFGEAADLRILENTTIESVERELRTDCHFTWALDLTLISLDSELDDNIRREALEGLEKLFAENTILARVESVLYSEPLPDDADLNGAFELYDAQGLSVVLQFLRRLRDNQPAVYRVNKAWDAIPAKTFGSYDNKIKFRHVAVREGLFRTLATFDPATSISELTTRLNESIKHLPNHRQVLKAWASEVQHYDLAEKSLKSALAELQQLKDRLQEENLYLKEEVRVASNFGQIIGQSEALRRVLHQAEKIASLDTTVLIHGEAGTGKELLARAIHNQSPRKKYPLVSVNCAAIPSSLIESELFGHAKGAFTGANTQRLGRFALADSGSIFLDQVSELPLDLQSKLLRVLEEGEFEPVGSSRTVKVNVRVIAADHNLAEAVTNYTFRSDLYYRLSIFPIEIPPLRERREDIPALVRYFVNQVSTKLGKRIETIPQDTINVLQNYYWPGNIRELYNVIERSVILTPGSKLQLSDTFSLSPITYDSKRDQDMDGQTLEEFEHRLILRALKSVHWQVEGPGGAAELLNVNASTLRSRMKKLGIVKPRARA